ncbi:hypothetical protein MAPG_04691 [Magnaporthiopsis poae ATCC 64411]|uniref:Uncharacterized protein n=1 Tax=Magnaporthiopsis poae (strain ATCC 64411 / 73-15) TaxID=644358 RepID=A0A0C4DXE4_MAGP6|nr:hypothetical protein MAPG_04691 [Magnaporthiopsis poae ATCC 64411]
MLSSIASSSRPTCSMHVRAAGIRSMARSSTVMLRSLDQTRGMRHGPRGSYPDPESAQEAMGRQRNRHKQLEAKNRKLAWDKHPNAMPVCKIEKRMASHYQRAQKPDAQGSGAGETTGWAGDGIEAVERGALENLLFGHRDGNTARTRQPKSAASPPSGPLAASIKEASVKTMPQDVLQSTIEPEYIIDPITNRKVLKSAAKESTSEQAGGPVFDMDMPVTSAELRQYSQVKIDDDGKTRITYQSGRGGVFLQWKSGVKVAGIEAVAEMVKTHAVKRGADDLSATLAKQSEDNKYTDLDKYKPIIEPEAPRQEDETPQYEDLDKYSPVMGKRTPVAHDPSAEYKDLDQYKPIMEERTPVPEDPSAGYQDLDKYTPVAHNEPDGKVMSPFEKETYTDLSKYSAVVHNEPDGKPLDYAEPCYDPAELSQYGAFKYNEPDGKPPTAQEPSEYTDLNLYGKAVRYQEPDGKPPSSADENRSYDDLNEYGPVRHLEPDGKPLDALASDPAASPEPYTDLGKYEAGVRYQEPDGTAPRPADTVAVSLGELDAIQQQTDLPAYSEPTDAEREAAELDRLRASEVRDAAAARALHGATSEAPRQDPSGNSAQSPSSSPGSGDAEAEAANSKAPTPSVSPSPRGPLQSRLTGSQRIHAVLDPFSRTPQGLETSYADECGGVPTWPTFVRTYGDPTVTGLGNRAAAVTPVKPPAASVIQQPTVYRILAYDPATQTVTTAETTSSAPDSSAAIPPTEALLKLSRPAQFFPYFPRLQQEGFEIVSGSSDILIFRKIQASLTSNTPTSEETKTQAAADAFADALPSVNPIDMTGSQPFLWEPASAKFASPTGYVHYEPEPVIDCRPPPPPPPHHVSQQQQRKPAGGNHGSFSSTAPGARAADEHNQRRQPARLAKRMAIGATWIAGVSYGIGVVSEYFKSGGTDGKGPTRF